jgi:hypothetical protein
MWKEKLPKNWDWRWHECVEYLKSKCTKVLETETRIQYKYFIIVRSRLLCK